MKRILIVGASSGIGEALASHLKDSGEQAPIEVYWTVRRNCLFDSISAF